MVSTTELFVSDNKLVTSQLRLNHARPRTRTSRGGPAPGAAPDLVEPQCGRPGPDARPPGSWRPGPARRRARASPDGSRSRERSPRVLTPFGMERPGVTVYPEPSGDAESFKLMAAIRNSIRGVSSGQSPGPASRRSS